jgi:RES domain-containing protein
VTGQQAAPAAPIEIQAGVPLPLLAWDAPLYCHAPVDTEFDPAALGDEGDGSDRWCGEGSPTAYLASDTGVAMAELARHHPPGGSAVERRIMRLEPRTGAVRALVDLRDEAVLRALGAPVELPRYLNRELARFVAQVVRGEERHAGIIVPSMAFLDRPDRPNVVLFGERASGAGGLRGLFAGWDEVARIEVGGR